MCNTAQEMYIRFCYLGPLEQIQSREYGERSILENPMGPVPLHFFFAFLGTYASDSSYEQEQPHSLFNQKKDLLKDIRELQKFLES